MIKAGIVGGTGYTGVELLRLLAQHPEVAIIRLEQLYPFPETELARVLGRHMVDPRPLLQRVGVV